MQKLAVAFAVVTFVAVNAVDPDLIGHWQFQANQNGNDVTGHFGAFALQGSASFTSNGLKVNGAGTTSTAWGYAGNYIGPSIASHTNGYTLAACGTIDSFNAWAGSFTTLDRVTIDQFDGLIFGEFETNKWAHGSSNGLRTTNFAPGFQETVTGQRVFVAYTSSVEGGNDRITGYRGLDPANNAQALNIGSYTKTKFDNWASGDAEVFFGLRHGSTGGGPGAMDATIHESWIYKRALTPSELAPYATQCLFPTPPPTPVPPTPAPTPAPTQDPAVAGFCADISSKCGILATECTGVRNNVGAPIASGVMGSGAGYNNNGQFVGSVALAGNTVVVTASGTLYCGGGCPNSPDGSTIATGSFLLNGVPRHSLIARIGGQSQPWQFVGSGPTRLTGTGALEFAFNDDGNAYGDNYGSYTVKIHATTDAIADDCDATQVACVEMHADCLTKVSTCPLVTDAPAPPIPNGGGGGSYNDPNGGLD